MDSSGHASKTLILAATIFAVAMMAIAFVVALATTKAGKVEEIVEEPSQPLAQHDRASRRTRT